MNAYVKAWQCIGCGKIEAPQTCIGVCQDRKVEFVYAFEHEEALAQLKVARQQAEALGHWFAGSRGQIRITTHGSTPTAPCRGRRVGFWRPLRVARRNTRLSARTSHERVAA